MQALSQMLGELESFKLEVQLVPLNPRLWNYNDGGMKRVVVCANPRWYRSLCAKFPSSRGTRKGKPDTRIRRATILSVLGRLSSGLPSRSKYAQELKAVAGRFTL